MKKLYEKNELAFALACIAAYVVLFSVADSLSASLGVAKSVTAPVGIVLSLALFAWMKSGGLLEKYGLCAFRGSWRSYLYFLPLLLIMSTNLWNGGAIKAPGVEILLHILSMVCVGFLEEVIFRGLLFKAISKSGVRQAVLISSITFGIGHIVNLLNGAEFFPTLLQICNAVALGFLFVILFHKGKSLWPCIIAHGMINSLSIFAVPGSRTLDMITAAILCGISLGYALWILKKAEIPEKA